MVKVKEKNKEKGKEKERVKLLTDYEIKHLVFEVLDLKISIIVYFVLWL